MPFISRNHWYARVKSIVLTVCDVDGALATRSTQTFQVYSQRCGAPHLSTGDPLHSRLHLTGGRCGRRLVARRSDYGRTKVARNTNWANQWQSMCGAPHGQSPRTTRSFHANRYDGLRMNCTQATRE